MTHRLALLRAIEWLASTHREPDRVRRDWLDGYNVLLPCGVYWDAVKIPASAVRRICGSDTDAQVQARFTELGVTGLVIVDPHHAFYLLVAPGAVDASRLPGVECLGEACHVVVPPVARTRRPGLRWLERPCDTDWLCSPEAVHAVVDAAFGPRRESAP